MKRFSKQDIIKAAKNMPKGSGGMGEPHKIRNPYSTHAKSRKAGPMKDRREPRGGARNEQRELAGTAKCGCYYHAEEGIPCEHDLQAKGAPQEGDQCPHGDYWYAEVESENPDFPVGSLTIDCNWCRSK